MERAIPDQEGVSVDTTEKTGSEEVPENSGKGTEKARRINILKRTVILLIVFLWGSLFVIMSFAVGSAKPVIYLYPEQKTEVRVRLDYRGVLECTYPEYASGWSVTAYPDGKLVNHAEYEFSRGFVVRGENTARFLREKLAYMGLTPAEYNEFIVYWYPRMRDNPYNLIAFQGKAYTDSAKLTVTPSPDSLLRVFMAYRRLSRPMDVPPQHLERFERRGVTVVEWGGAEVR